MGWQSKERNETSYSWSEPSGNCCVHIWQWKYTSEVSENWLACMYPLKRQYASSRIWCLLCRQCRDSSWENCALPKQYYHKTQTGLVSEAIQQIQPSSNKFGTHCWSTDDYWQQLLGDCNGATSQFFEGKTVQSRQRRTNYTGVNRTILHNLLEPPWKFTRRRTHWQGIGSIW